MNKQNDLQKGFYLEDWHVQPQLGRLSRSGESVQLEPKIMNVLLILAEHQGEVVKKEHFFQNTWSDVNVTPHVLARAISEIRRALKDAPQNPRFIQTVPKIGYRLIAHVTAKTDNEVSGDFQLNPSSQPYSQLYFPQMNLTHLLFFLGSLAVIMLFFAVLIIFMTNRHGNAGFHFH